MDNLQNRFIEQVDGLIPFLALGHEEVFDVLRTKYEDWLPEWQRDSVPETFIKHQTQVAHGAFLLGYSYYEAFLADLMKAILRARPKLLSPDKDLKYSDVLNASDYSVLVDFMIDREVLGVMYGSMKAIILCFEKRLNLQWPSDLVEGACEASLIRNCIIHNNCVVSSDLSKFGDWKVGETIALSASSVHDYGFTVRRIARELYRQAQSHHLQGE